MYWDDEAMDRSNLGGQEAHRRIPDHFVRKGYERLDTLAIAQFMEARVRDRTPSVVVFGMDYLPRAITGEPDGLETSLLRRYLDSGGKVLWLSNPPLSVLIDPESGQFIGLDRDRPRRLLGVGHGPWNTDLYPVRITPGGERWGLSQPWMGGPVADAKDVTEVLAHDEMHRPVAWVRNYGGAPGTGFVHLRPSVDGLYSKRYVESRSTEFSMGRPGEEGLGGVATALPRGGSASGFFLGVAAAFWLFVGLLAGTQEFLAFPSSSWSGHLIGP